VAKIHERKLKRGISTANVDILNPTKVADKSTNKSIGSPVTGHGLHTIKNGARRLTDCPTANETLMTALGAAGADLSVEQVVEILGGIERDFNCASLCKRSNIFAFSEVSRGPPPQTCRRSVTTKTAHLSKVFFWTSLIFAIITFLGFVLAIMISFEKRNEMDEPLLQR